jgi:hypothetical protein
MITLHASRMVLDGPDIYAAEYLGQRPRGSVDLVISLARAGMRAYLMMRRDPGAPWRRVVGEWLTLGDAVQLGTLQLRREAVDADLARRLAPILGGVA